MVARKLAVNEAVGMVSKERDKLESDLEREALEKQLVE